mmetsp:Transcript_77957/g.154562  ORF Transcript_77957/g.154562 Transcript_77957/m.154562 type:complete len:84 (-) Transcript_77957:77-328(-)
MAMQVQPPSLQPSNPGTQTDRPQHQVSSCLKMTNPAFVACALNRLTSLPLASIFSAVNAKGNCLLLDVLFAADLWSSPAVAIQ